MDWASSRTASALKAVEIKIEATLSEHVSTTGRWDLESFRLALADYKPRREHLVAQGMADV
jgi:hypothetical protein